MADLHSRLVLSCGTAVAAVASALLMAQPALAQGTAGNQPPVPGDSPSSAPISNSNLPAAVPGGSDAGNAVSTTPVLNQDRAVPAQGAASPVADAGANGTANVADIVVTGSRLSNGMKTPTPVTVTTASQLLQAAPNNIADGLARLPAFGGSTSTTAPVSSGTTGTVGQNLLNLRGLGDNRNLVLLDGRRVVTNNQDFAVDVNTLPQNLISRVDVVTGGASAAYGSDAVAGVVNFVLDTRFTGFKGEASSGISTYGDAPGHKFSAAYGGDFLGGKLHVIASEIYYKQQGITPLATGRAWFNRTPGLIPNVGSTTPTNLVLNDIRSSVATTGGLITTAGPLFDTNFTAGGTPVRFDRGFNSGSVFQSGGAGAKANFGFTPAQERSASFVHATLDISPDVQAFGEFSYAYSNTVFDNSVITLTGGTYAFQIYPDNAYLNQSAPGVAATMRANNIASFRMGKFLADFPDFHVINRTNTFREAGGVKGKNLFGLSGWNWDVSYTHGESHQYYAEDNVTNLRNLYASADAVVNPATGQIVCRSQYYNGNTFVPGGTGRDAGCVPVNYLGDGVATNNKAGIAYVDGTTAKRLAITQDVVEARLSGDFGKFALAAGPISFAIGGDWRRDKASQTADAVSQQVLDGTGIRGLPSALQGRLGGWRFGNFQPFTGRQTVKEGFAELGVPILKDLPFAYALTADVAGRYTSYSLAGDVQTWKAGLDYAPVPDLRFRGTVSRDIRAPDLLQLFNTAIINTNTVIYPSSTATGARSLQNLVTTTGNPNLTPEKALTQTYGVVLTPRFLPHFSLSVDYFHIKIKDAITTLTAQNIVDFCAAGQTQYCSFEQLDTANNRVLITLAPLNLSKLVVSGIDIEANYSHEIFGNPFSVRLLANHSISNFSQAPNAAPLLQQGSAVAPQWKAQAQFQYNVGGFGVFLNERFISAVKMDPNQVEGIYTNRNHVPAIAYTDITFTQDVKVAGSTTQLFLSIENLLNQDPPIDVIPPTSVTNPTNNAYDRLGRYFTAGVRFKF